MGCRPRSGTPLLDGSTRPPHPISTSVSTGSQHARAWFLAQLDHLSIMALSAEFYTQVMEQQMANTSSGMMADTHDAQLASSAAKEMLKEMARKDPHYKRNRPHICSFFLKGDCKRGNECPFR